MSEALTINGKKLLPIKEVMGRTKYTRDYIAKLARDGQIVGAQVGRQWFIDDSSLARFITTTELEAEVRKRQLSRERRREREVKVEITNRFAGVAAHPRYGAGRGVARALVVVVCGFLSGCALYTAPDFVAKTVALQRASSPLVFSTEVLSSEQEKHALPVASHTEERPVFSDTHEARRFDEGAQGVLLIPARSAETPVEVAELFSDPVAVAFVAPGVGTVSLPGSDAGTTTGISFVTVPVETVSTQSPLVPSAVVPEATP